MNKTLKKIIYGSTVVIPILMMPYLHKVNHLSIKLTILTAVVSSALCFTVAFLTTKYIDGDSDDQ